VNTRQYFIEVNGIKIEVVRKAIKHLRLAVYPPSGRVRIAAPLRVHDDALRLMVMEKLAWIHKQQARVMAMPAQPKIEMRSGENHYFQGRRYCLNVIEYSGKQHRVESGENNSLHLYVRSNTSVEQRAAVLNAWYREHLQREIPLLIAKWQPVMAVQVAAWGVKKMKTRWGSCNIRVRRIWLNLELAKHSAGCLEYVVVHEMVHLLERSHNERFKKFMDQFLPQWRLLKAELNRSVPGQDAWSY
jgi:predicted metal-dependent hydrolase